MLLIGLATAFAAAPAIAAVEFVCHPDPAGTHAVSVVGKVQGYELHNGTVTIAIRAKRGCARLLRWHARQDVGKLERLPGCASRAIAPCLGLDGRPMAAALPLWAPTVPSRSRVTATQSQLCSLTQRAHVN